MNFNSIKYYTKQGHSENDEITSRLLIAAIIIVAMINVIIVSVQP